MSALLALLLTLSPARAGEIVVGASGGFDFPTSQFWAGPEFALQPDGDANWAPVVRVHPAWGFSDKYPFLYLEAGLEHGLPVVGARALRVGLVASTEVVGETYRLPLMFADGARRWGLIPGIEATVELEFFEKRPLIVGVRGGVSAASSNYLCAQPNQVDDCLTWFPGFTGGFYARGQVVKNLYVEGLVGPSPRLGVGYAF